MPRPKQQKQQPTPKQDLIDREQFEKLLVIDGSCMEVACWFGVSEDVVRTWVKNNYFYDDGKPMTFEVVKAIKGSSGTLSLKRKAMATAMNGSENMMRFLLKNRAGYSDNPDSNNVKEPVSFTVNINTPDSVKQTEAWEEETDVQEDEWDALEHEETLEDEWEE